MFSFSRGLCAGFTFKRHVVFREPRDNREITVTCSAKYAILTELNLQVSRKCVGDSSTARFKKDDKKRFAKIPVSRLYRQCAETLRKLHGNSARDTRPQRGKKRDTGGFARGGAKLVITNCSRSSSYFEFDSRILQSAYVRGFFQYSSVDLRIALVVILFRFCHAFLT